ncbi:MAG: uroporphyrinogen decarboxylase family protein [Sedimentisphaerales bacterium]
MTSRERILAALNHREPDRAGIDFSGHRSSGIAAIAYPKLREFLGLPPKPVRVYDVIQQLAIVDEDVLDRFHVDTIELGRGFALDDPAPIVPCEQNLASSGISAGASAQLVRGWSPWTLPDGTPCFVPAWTQIEREAGRWVIRSKTGRVLAHMPEGTLYFEQVYYPFLEGNGGPNDDPEAIAGALEECMWTAGVISSPPGSIGSQQLCEGARRLREKTDRAIIGLFGGNLFEMGQFLYRNDQFLMLLASQPKRAHRFLDKIVEIHLANLERFLGAVGEYIDIILFGDDLGMQTGPMLSPPMYREFFKARHKVLWNRAKELADVKVMLHCCGGIRELIPHLIEAGLDAINPVQISCAGMDAAELKAEFGAELTFWGGGCDTRDVLANSTPQQVAEHVKKQVKIFNRGGGFVFQQVHNILANVPPENIVAMFDAVNDAA